MFDSPYRLTALTAASSLLTTVAFALANLPPVYHSLALLAACFALVCVGVVSMYWTAYRLREDVRNERWSEESLAPWRRVVNHIVWKLVMALLVMAMFVVLVKYWHHRNDLFWSVFFLLQAQTQIGSAFARPRKPNGRSGRLDWATIAPLWSEHWGER